MKLEILVPNDGRKVKKFINIILKKNFAEEIIRINYIKHYQKDKKTVKSQEKKLLTIYYQNDNQKDIQAIAEKIFGQDFKFLN